MDFEVDELERNLGLFELLIVVSLSENIGVGDLLLRRQGNVSGSVWQQTEARRQLRLQRASLFRKLLVYSRPLPL